MSKFSTEKSENPPRREKRIPDVEWLFGYGENNRKKGRNNE
jgi:hypothetical protein